MRPKAVVGALFAGVLLGSSAAASDAPTCAVELVVLGAGQDAGAPQIGNADDSGPRLLPSSLGLIDRTNGARYLLDASPAITEQLAILDAIEAPAEGLGIDGVFLTHAHIGHYLGLAYLGQEAAGASGVPVYAMPRMADFLRTNGPWSQLEELGNIALTQIPEGDELQAVALAPDLVVIALPVPHRDEFSEVAAFLIVTEAQRVLYLPDIDGWEGWSDQDMPMLERMVAYADHVFLDATFWDDNELEGRDMSAIPHPRVTATMDRLQTLPASQRAKVHFVHYNHTNPIRDPASAEAREVLERGFNVARRGDRHCLAGAP